MKKRILVLLLALVMVAGFALPAVAAQDEIVSDEPVVIAEEASTTEEETSTTEEEASTTEEEASTTEEETSTTEEASTTEEETSTTEESVDEPAPASVEAEDEALLAAVSVSDGAGTHTPSTKTVEYVDENGVTRTVTATKIESNSTTGGDGGYDYKDWNTGWYYVEGTKELGGGAISVSGNVNLILCDGATLTSPYGVGRPSGIELANDASLTIYGQSAQTGKLVACITGYNKGTLTVNGGKVVAMGENEIMETCGVSFSNGSLTMTVNGGEVTAAGGDVQSGPGLSYGMDLGSGSLTVNGGKVTASGGVVSNNPVSKSYGIIGNVTFNGGTLVAKTTSTSGAKAAFSAAPTLSGSAYYWRTAESGNFAASATTAYTHGNNTYVELTTQPNGGGYISYMAWDDTNKKLTPAVIADGDYTVVTGRTSMVEWGNSETMQEVWYVVKDDVTISGQPYALWIVGRVNLILCDGATLTVQDSEGYDINCSYEGFSLTIYGQTAQTGRLKVPSADNIISIQCTGPITVNGGVIDVSAGKLSTNCVIEGDGGMTLHNGTIKVSRDEGPGMFRANPTLPATYYWRTAADGKYRSQKSFTDDALEGQYLEVTTTKPADSELYSVEYMDWNSTTNTLNTTASKCYDPIAVTSDMTTLGERGKETWYVVDADTTIDSAVTVTGNVNLILCDGKALKVEQSTGVDLLTVADGGSLTVYGQSGQSGFLNLKPADGESTGSGVTNGIRGSVTVNGGRVYAQGANQHGIDGAVTVNHGEVEAVGNLCGISGAVTVNGGKVVAESAGDSSGFGNTVNLVSGTVIAKSSDGNAITTAPTLPTTYYWRTADGAKYRTQASYDASALAMKYFEVTTTAPADNMLDQIKYKAWDASKKELVDAVCEGATKVTSSMTTWGESGKETWYYVEGNETIDWVTSMQFICGNVNLILCDGATLTLNNTAIVSYDGNDSLTIYAQSTGASAGKLVVDISERYKALKAINLRNLTVNGGTVEAKGEAFGIYLEKQFSASLTINQGTVIATRFSDDDGKAVGTYENAPVTLPTTYYWRTADNANYKTQKVLHTTSDLKGKYFEVTTTKPTSNIEPYVTGAAATVTYGDAVNGSVIKATTEVNGAFAWKNVASYGDASAAPRKLMATFTPSDSSYVAVDVEVSVTVNQKDLTVTAKDHSITYGDEAANDGVTYDGFVAGEDESKLGGTLAYEYTYSRYGDVGSGYTITPKGLTSGNYNIKFRSGALTVEPKTIGIDWSDTKLTHNGKAQKPTATATGLVNGDECTITVTGEQTEAGTYTATATGLDNPNYRLPENVTCEFTIAAAKADGKGKAPHTGDAGIALYVISAVSSMTGLVWLGRKKKR